MSCGPDRLIRPGPRRYPRAIPTCRRSSRRQRRPVVVPSGALVCFWCANKDPAPATP